MVISHLSAWYVREYVRRSDCAKAQNKEVEREVSIDPAIDLEVDAFIDDAYIKDSARKIPYINDCYILNPKSSSMI